MTERHSQPLQLDAFCLRVKEVKKHLDNLDSGQSCGGLVEQEAVSGEGHRNHFSLI